LKPFQGLIEPKFETRIPQSEIIHPAICFSSPTATWLVQKTSDAVPRVFDASEKSGQRMKAGRSYRKQS
jgi:hypothetical protein